MMNINSFKFTIVLAVLHMLLGFMFISKLLSFSRATEYIVFVSLHIIRFLGIAAIIWVFARKNLTFPAICNAVIIVLIVSRIVNELVLGGRIYFSS